jgi:hypothetical protein
VSWDIDCPEQPFELLRKTMNEQEIGDCRCRSRRREMGRDCSWHGRRPFKVALVQLSSARIRHLFFRPRENQSNESLIAKRHHKAETHSLARKVVPMISEAEGKFTRPILEVFSEIAGHFFDKSHSV